MYQLIVKQTAIDMADEAYQWYEKEQPGLGAIFFKELESCYDRVETWPTSYAVIHNDFRQAVLHKFPYVVVFRIIKSDIVVYSVFHTSRNPKKKFRRNS